MRLPQLFLPRTKHGAVRPWLAGALAAISCLPFLLFAQPPAWWTQREVLDTTAQADDYAAVNQGQLKHIAKQAYLEMEAKLPGGAGEPIEAMVAAWQSGASTADDYAALNIGQVKNVAKPFYDRLIATGIATRYPWETDESSVDNYHLANIGQVKQLFSFTLSPVLLFSADFESGQNYELGPILDQNNWTTGNNTGAIVTDTKSFSGSNSIELKGSLEDWGWAYQEIISDPAETVVFIDFYAQLSAGEDIGLNPYWWSYLSWVSLMKNGSSVEVYVYEGDLRDDSGELVRQGGWRGTGHRLPLLDDGNQMENWARFTVREDYETHKFDIFVDGIIIAADIIGNDFEFNQFQGFDIGSGISSPSYIDKISIGYENPLFIDVDKDGMNDTWEINHGLNPASKDGELDADQDRLTNKREYLAGTDPNDPDTDGDSMLDGWEWKRGLNPKDPTDADAPSDIEGKTNREKFLIPVGEVSDLSIEVTADGKLAMSWSSTAPTNDDVTYEIYLNGQKIFETSALHALISRAPINGLLHFYSVRARGDNGISSTTSAEVLDNRTPDFSNLIYELKHASASRSKGGIQPSFLGGTYYLKSNYHRRDTEESYDGDIRISHLENDLVIKETYNIETETLASIVEGSMTSSGRSDFAAQGTWQLNTNNESYPFAQLIQPPISPTYQTVLLPSDHAPFFSAEDGPENHKTKSTSYDYIDSYGRHNSGNHLSEWILSDEYTDDLLETKTLSDYAIARSISSGLAWNTSATKDGFRSDFHDGSPYPAEKHESRDFWDNITWLSISSSEYRYKIPSPAAAGSVTLRWAEVFSPEEGPVQVTEKQGVATAHNDGYYTEAYLISPPPTPGIVTLMPIQSTAQMRTPSQSPATDAPRLYLQDALWVNEAGEITFTNPSPEGLIYEASDNTTALRLVAVDPSVIDALGETAAIAQGLEIAPGTDMIVNANSAGLPNGWKLFAIGMAPTTVNITFKANVSGISTSIKKIVTILPKLELSMDANRDGVIRLASEDTSDQTSVFSPYRFWINDDNDSGGIATCDIPESSTPDGQKTKVQGVRDLIDYFPVFLDIKQLLAVLPPGTNDITYKLKQADDAVRFVYTDLKREDAFKYLTDNATGTALKDADAHWATSAGYPLDATWLGQVKDGDKGVILVTGRNPTDKPLRLVVEKAGAEIAEISLNIKISPVEDMFRHLNLREGADAAPGLVGDRRDSGKATRLGDPTGLPDTSPNQPWFIFLVGSNVGGQSSRGWEAESFKRLYWSRGDDGKFAKTRFLGVSWFGDPYANGSDGVYDYHLAVRNAFATAPALASRVNSLPGNGAKTIGGHSLACGVIAAALSDHGMNVNHAALVDAAVAREVFDGRAGSGDQLSDEESGMTPAVWRNYAMRLQSPSWHERFAGLSGDNRQALTWRNRFIGAVPKIHSFYSSTEDVLGSYNGEVPSTALGAAAVVIMDGAAFTAYVWVYQEKAKGNRQDYWMIGIGSFHAGSTYMGWGMNLKDPLLSGDPTHWKWVNSYDYIGRMIKTSAEIGNVSDSVLRRHPVFEPGWGVVRNQEQQEIPVSNVSPVDNAPSWIYDLYGATSGSTQAGAKTSANHAQLLAEAIPAQSWAVGSHQLNSSTLPISKQHNMPAEYAGPGWPRSLINGVREWRHSDMREVPYLHQSRFWDALVSISQQP